MTSWNLETRHGLMNAATSFYAGMLILSGLLWWATGIDLRSQLWIGVWTIPLGLAGVIPMLPALYLAPGLRDLVTKMLGPSLSRCRLIDLVMLAALAGVGEELLFRGALQEWWSRFGIVVGLLATNLVFGGLHALTPAYFGFATLIGIYLSGLAEVGPGRNLVPPMIAHGVYDLIGFLSIVKEYRQQEQSDAESSKATNIPDSAAESSDQGPAEPEP